MPSSSGSISSFLRNLHIVLHSGYQFAFPPAVQEDSLFSTPPLAFTIVCILFDGGHSDRCEMIPHCSFDLHFSNNNDVEHFLMCLLAICMSSLEKKAI